MYKLAIFDLDGTLLNTIDDIAGAVNHIMKKYGFKTYDNESVKRFIGSGTRNLILRAIGENSGDTAEIDAIHEDFLEYYSEHVADLTRPYDGIVDMLKAIKKSGVIVSVYSNKPDNSTKLTCEKYFPGLIDMSVGFISGAKLKPDPETGIRIMERFSALCGETVYIGDSDVDMQTAKALDVLAVGVSWGYRTKEMLKNAGADVILDNAADITKIIIDKMAHV